ncbi:MAG: DUF4118 domain-containing protein [Collinsella sp.]
MDVRTDGDIADSFWWRRTTLTRRTPLYDACVSVGLLVAATIAGALLDHPGLAPSIMIVYVFAVQLCAFFTWSRLYCLLSSAAAVALYNFLFVDPRYSLSLIDRVYPGMFFIMFVVSLVSSSIALALRRALAQAAASDRRTHMVLETNRMLQRCADEQQIVMPWQRSWRVFRAVRSCGTAPTPRAMTCCHVRRTRPGRCRAGA